MCINNVDLSPIVTAGRTLWAVRAAFRVWPSAVKILDIIEFRQQSTIRTYKNQGVRDETNPTGLIEREVSGIDGRFVLMTQEGAVEALLGQYLRGLSAIRGALKPALDIFGEMFKHLFLDCW
jgi:hypothetical protein